MTLDVLATTTAAILRIQLNYCICQTVLLKSLGSIRTSLGSTEGYRIVCLVLLLLIYLVLVYFAYYTYYLYIVMLIFRKNKTRKNFWKFFKNLVFEVNQIISCAVAVSGGKSLRFGIRQRIFIHHISKKNNNEQKK